MDIVSRSYTNPCTPVCYNAQMAQLRESSPLDVFFQLACSVIPFSAYCLGNGVGLTL